MTHAAPAMSMPPASQTFAIEQARPVRHGIDIEHAAPTPPPGGMTTSPVASPIGPPSFVPPPAPPVPAPPAPASSNDTVTGLELLHPMTTAAQTPTHRNPSKLFPIAHLAIPHANTRASVLSAEWMWAQATSFACRG